MRRRIARFFMRGQMIQMLARFFGVVLLVVGILGFDPLIVHYEDLAFAGRDSTAELVGVFQVSVLLNLLHVVFGVAGILLARSWEGARAFMVGGALTYLGLGVFGLAVSADSNANFLPTNGADDVLHLALGLPMLLGWVANADDRDKVSLD